MKKTTFIILLLALFLSASSLVYAGHLVISPVRLTIPSGQSIGSIAIGNKFSDAKTFQIFIKAWNQSNGKDELIDTKDLIVTPPMFQLFPDEQQIIRIGLRHPQESMIEQTYRLLITELKNKNLSAFFKAKHNPGLKFLYAINTPVFISPVKETPKEISWQVKRITKNKIQLMAINHSNIHIRIDRLILGDENKINKNIQLNSMVYILGGQTRQWSFDVPNKMKFSKEIKLLAKTDWQEFKETIPVVGL